MYRTKHIMMLRYGFSLYISDGGSNSNNGLCQVEECSRFGLPPAIFRSPSSVANLERERNKIGFDANQPFTISCVHVESCLLSSSKLKEAQALTVKHSVLNAMSISADWKQSIWLRARKNGPLAQRVSHTTVFRCNT